MAGRETHTYYVGGVGCVNEVVEDEFTLDELKGDLEGVEVDGQSSLPRHIEGLSLVLLPVNGEIVLDADCDGVRAVSQGGHHDIGLTCK